jgi:hypothetical protein
MAVKALIHSRSTKAIFPIKKGKYSFCKLFLPFFDEMLAADFKGLAERKGLLRLS